MKKSWLNRITRYAPFFLLLTLCVGTGACSRAKTGAKIDINHSINIGFPEKDWPGKITDLTPVQQEVYELKGRPSCIRYWWNEDGSYSTFTEVWDESERRDNVSMPQSWCYIIHNEEVLFESTMLYSIRSIPDKLKVIYKEGDPENITFSTNSFGEETEIWTYYSSGYIYTFLNDKLLKQKREFNPMGPYIKR